MKKRLMNNIGLKVLAFFAAVMSWLMVVNIDDPVTTQTYYNIPVSVMNEDVLSKSSQTYRIVDDAQTVDVVVNANRSVLDKIKNKNISAIADMRELTLNTQIPIQVKINGFEGEYKEAQSIPKNLIVILEEEESKKFPIVPTTTGTVRDGYALGEIKAIPEKVFIRGPKSIIRKISRVEAGASVSGLSADTLVQSQLTLYDEENNVIDQSLLKNNLGAEGVAVSIQILNTKNVPLVFDESAIHAAEGYSLTGVTYEPEEVQVSGTKENLAQISKVEIPAFVLEQSGLTARREKIVDITEYLPDTVKLVDENAGSVVVTISVEKDGTKSYDVSLGAIVVDSLDEGLLMSYETADVVEIQIRGPQDVLKSFEAKENVSINLAEFKEPGRYTVPVRVKVPEGCVLEKQISLNIILEKK